ncbi:ATP-binding protein, partial [Microbacterium sp.]|uniref:ATP-binding protein n=1 Tax=Microbacterium sp. TaxID=51671 RepID=UPI003C1B728A
MDVSGLRAPPGRDSEFEQLERACRDGRDVVLSGPPGIGKSTLLGAFMEHCAQERVELHIRGSSAGVPLGAFTGRARLDGALRRDAGLEEVVSTVLRHGVEVIGVDDLDV